MDDRVAVDIVEVGNDAGFEFGLGRDTDVSEHRACHFGEEALDEVEPGAMLGGEYEGEPALGLGFDPRLAMTPTRHIITKAAYKSPRDRGNPSPGITFTESVY